MSRLLVVTAVDAERDAVVAGLAGRPGRPASQVDVLVAGVGMASAGAYAGVALSRGSAQEAPYRYVCSLGIGGAFAGRAAIGDVVVGTRSVAADLGAQSPEGFLSLATLGFGQSDLDCDADLVSRLGIALPGAIAGEILTVSTVTGTATRAAELADRHPAAVVEAMEGYGVAMAAAAVRIPFVEIRTISNLVGLRDRGAWRIKEALAALSDAASALGTLVG